MGVKLGSIPLLALLSGAACSGTSGAQFAPGAQIAPLTPTAASLSEARVKSGVGSLLITLPPIQPANTAINWAANPQLLAPKTQSAVVTVAQERFGPFVLSPTTNGCVAATLGLTCTITVKRVPVAGNAGVQIKTYGNTAGKGSALAIELLYVPVVAKKATQLSPAMRGAAKEFVLFAADASFTIGQYANETFVLAGIDALGESIPSTSVVQTNGVPVPNVSILYSGFSKGRLYNTATYRYGHPPKTTLFACCGNLPTIFPYDGLQSKPETFTVVATGFPKTTLVMDAVPGNQSLAALLVANAFVETSSNPSLEMFPRGANGNIAPARAIVLRNFSTVFGEDAKGDFWAFATRYTNLGRVVGTLNLPEGQLPKASDAVGNLFAIAEDTTCSIYEYPAGRYGKIAAIREIDYDCGLPTSSQERSPAMAVDASGDVFVAVDLSSPSILEFAPGSGSGTLTPIRTIALPANAAGTRTPSIDVDASGNLYVLDSGTSTVYEAAPSATTASEILANVAAQKMAVDDDGDIFAWVNPGTYQGANEIDVFAPGSSVPVRTIAGSATGLASPGEISVARSWVSSARKRPATMMPALRSVKR